MAEYADARAFLSSVWRRKMAVRQCMWELDLLRDRCEQITACLKGPRSGAGDPHRDGILAALADKQSELMELEQALMEREKEAEDFLKNIADERCRAILRLRYMEQLRWTEVRVKLEELQFYYSERQIYNLHRRAVQKAEGLFLKLRQLPRGA